MLYYYNIINNDMDNNHVIKIKAKKNIINKQRYTY